MRAPQRSAAPCGTPIDRLISRLAGVKETGPSRWVARCPAHDDGHPSLSIRELPDGRVLIYDFAGCSAADIVASIGLTVADLFTQAIGHHLPKARATFPALPILRALSIEAGIVFYCGAALLAGEPFDSERLRIAIERIDAGLRIAEGRA